MIVSILVGGYNGILFYQLSRRGKDVEVTICAKISRKKQELDEDRLIKHEPIPSEVGRPRQRLILGFAVSESVVRWRFFWRRCYLGDFQRQVGPRDSANLDNLCWRAFVGSQDSYDVGCQRDGNYRSSVSDEGKRSESTTIFSRPFRTRAI